MYRTALEGILGMTKNGPYLSVNPCIPEEWDGFEILYRVQNRAYKFVVKNPEHVSKGVIRITLNGKELDARGLLMSEEVKEIARLIAKVKKGGEEAGEKQIKEQQNVEKEKKETHGGQSEMERVKVEEEKKAAPAEQGNEAEKKAEEQREQEAAIQEKKAEEERKLVELEPEDKLVIVEILMGRKH